MCSTCYSQFREYVLHNKPAINSKLVSCKCGKLTKHFAEGMCQSCYHQNWYIKNQDKRLRQEKDRKKLYNPEKAKRDYERLKNSPILTHKQKMRDYMRHRKKELIKLRNNCCEICYSNKDLTIHHKKYTTNYEDMLVVCVDCHHNKIHRKYKMVIKN